VADLPLPLVVAMPTGGVHCGKDSPQPSVPLLPPELAQVLSRAAGVLAACRVCVASRAHNSALGSVFLRGLADELPCRVRIFGGHSGRGQGPHHPLSTTDCFDPMSGLWESLRPMPTARYDCSAACVAGFLYVVGGRDGSEPEFALGTMERFDPADGRWASLPSVPTPRYRGAAAAVGGKLCVVGGCGELQTLAVVDRFDPERVVWEVLPPLAGKGRSHCAAASVGGFLHVVGGADTGFRSLRTVECLDCALGRWELLQPMPTPRFSCAAAVVAGMLYVAGGVSDGWSPVPTVERFDAAASAWEALEDMDAPRRDFVAVVSAGCVYVLGGISYGGRCIAKVERFDPASAKWGVSRPLPSARSSCAAVASWQ